MKYIKLFETAAAFESARATLDLPNVSLTENDMDVHYLPYVAPVTPTYEYVDLGLPSGIKWANMNVGANSITDTGIYFAWGDTQGYTADQVSGSSTPHKDFSWADYEYGNGGSSAADMTKYNSTDGKTVLDLEDDAAHVNMGGSWRMPTEADFNELLNTSYCTKSWVTNYEGSGVNGYLFTSKANGNALFFPAVGICNSGSVSNVGSYGRFWSSSLYTSVVIYGRYLSFGSDYCNADYNNRYYGYAVRGVIG